MESWTALQEKKWEKNYHWLQQVKSEVLRVLPLLAGLNKKSFPELCSNLWNPPWKCPAVHAEDTCWFIVLFLPPDGSSISQHISILIPKNPPCQNHALLLLCPSQWLLSILSSASMDAFEIGWKKNIDAEREVSLKIININYSSYVFLFLSCLRSLQAEESTRQPELFKFSWRTEIWTVHREEQIKFPGAAQDESKRSPQYKKNHSLLVCVPVFVCCFKTLQKWSSLRRPLEMLGSLQSRGKFSGNSPSLSYSQNWTGTFCLICILRFRLTPLPFPCHVPLFWSYFLANFPSFLHGEGREGRKGFSNHQNMSHQSVWGQKGWQRGWANTLIQWLARGRVDMPGPSHHGPPALGFSLWDPSQQPGRAKRSEKQPWGSLL